MTTAAKRTLRSVDELALADREHLELAHGRLREATKNYEQFLCGPLDPKQDVPVHDARVMAAAQAEVQVAEDELWKFREDLLGWTRPAWAPKATLVADWFSDEDRIYDQA